jgi:hypothetical protein
MQHSAVLIIPAALKPAADAIGAAMGWGPCSYTVPLTADGETVTHYAARADVGDGFLHMVAGLDPLPEGIGEHAAPVLAALVADFSPGLPSDDAPERPTLWGREHFDAVLAAHGFSIAETDP